jgi:hypothetical protein
LRCSLFNSKVIWFSQMCGNVFVYGLLRVSSNQFSK